MQSGTRPGSIIGFSFGVMLITSLIPCRRQSRVVFLSFAISFAPSAQVLIHGWELSRREIADVGGAGTTIAIVVILGLDAPLALMLLLIIRLVSTESAGSVAILATSTPTSSLLHNKRQLVIILSIIFA